jgi:hypothetical protein
MSTVHTNTQRKRETEAIAKTQLNQIWGKGGARHFLKLSNDCIVHPKLKNTKQYENLGSLIHGSLFKGFDIRLMANKEPGGALHPSMGRHQLGD